MEKIQENKDTCKEVLSILAFCDEEIIKKIPTQVMRKLMEIAADSEESYYIEKNKKLCEQYITEESKDLISLIFYSYIADENEKKELLDAWNKNEDVYQEKLREKYNPDNIFEKRRTTYNEQAITNELAVVEYKETLINKIINKIKKLFKIK